MRELSQNNAMAECALALAMAFFSIMVLTMVSMGAGPQAPAARPAALAEGVTVRPSAPPGATARDDRAPREDVVVVHYAGRFFDARLRPVDPAALPPDRRVTLAIEPTLPMAEAIAVRRRVPHPDLTVTTLDDGWLNALKEMPR